MIFGAGGDLTKRLLVPALYNLPGSKLLPDRFSVVGVDRAEKDDASWRDALTEVMQELTRDKTAEFYTSTVNGDAWYWVMERLRYLQGDFSQDELFARLGQILGGSNAVFYLAVAACFFRTVVGGLGKAGLLRQEGDRFRRVVIEKPFGADLLGASAKRAHPAAGR